MMKYLALVFMLTMVTPGLAKEAPVKTEATKVKPEKTEAPKLVHPKNAAGSPLIAKTVVKFAIEKYADGSTVWKPFGSFHVQVSKNHVKVYNEQAIDRMPKHLQEAHKKHIEGKSDQEVVSLATFSDLLGTNDPALKYIEANIVKAAAGIVTGVASGDLLHAGLSGAQFVQGVYVGAKLSNFVDNLRAKYKSMMDLKSHEAPPVYVSIQSMHQTPPCKAMTLMGCVK